MSRIPLLIAFLLIANFACKDKKKTKEDSFIFLEEYGYVNDVRNGIAIYRLKESREVMNGYYVVANDYGKSEELNIVNGVLQGVSLVFHNNNTVYSETNYLNGKRHGLEKIYYPSGNKSSAKTFKNGILVGTSTEYYETGQLQHESIVENGKTKERTSFDLLGTIKSQQFIRNSRTVTQYINNGQITYEHILSNYDDFDAMKFYNENGKIEVFLRVLHDDEEDGNILIELDSLENEIKRINLKANPEKITDYSSYFSKLRS